MDLINLPKLFFLYNLGAYHYHIIFFFFKWAYHYHEILKTTYLHQIRRKLDSMNRCVASCWFKYIYIYIYLLLFFFFAWFIGVLFYGWFFFLIYTLPSNFCLKNIKWYSIFFSIFWKFFLKVSQIDIMQKLFSKM